MSTRSQKKVTKTVPTTPTRKRVENSWILLAKDTLLNNSSFCIITLPHPAHGKPTKYGLDDSNKKIYEVVTFDEPHRSWFIGESVKSDGSLQIMTPVNPIFLVLPRLKEQCDSRAVPLEDLLAEKGFDKILSFVKNLDSVADLKGSADLQAYKYNEDKILEWLEDRVRRVAKALRSKNVHVTSGSVSATFVTSNISKDDIDEEFYLKYAFGMISEYLQDDIISKLEKKFSFQPDLIESVGKKRKSDAVDSKDNKKIKSDTSIDESKENSISNFFKADVKKQKPLTAKEKAREKAANGTKTISSFFTKK